MADKLPPEAEQLIEGEPDLPPEAPRERRTCEIEEFWEEGRRYLGLRARVGEADRENYERPGQYVTLSPDDHLTPRFLVIASAPGSASEHGWEFLVDRQTDLGVSLEPVTRGSTIAISAPEGPGWPVDAVAGRPLVCFATGSGIASLRPALQYWQHHTDRAPSQVTIYYGESDPADFAYLDESSAWNRRGIRTFHCDGSLRDDADGYRYVQDAFEADDPELDGAHVFLAGAPVMKRAVVGRLLDRGVPLDRIVTNI